MDEDYGTINVDIGKQLRDKLKIAAIRESKLMYELVIELLREGLKAKEAKRGE